MKEEFEKWYREAFCNSLTEFAKREILAIRSDGQYASIHVHGAWEAWRHLTTEEVPSEPSATSPIQ